ncbi:MAG TPA: hypothetical protein VIY56_05240 [Vicinamibacterales bacterium]
MRPRHSVLALGTAALALWGPASGTLAHKPITSPFTFYEDVLPITRAKCGQCHAPEGIAPMSLLTPESAVPWGESLKLELVAGHMPPWGSLMPADRFVGRPRLTARELNVLLTWAAGGTPTGDPATATDDGPPVARWPLGPPDVVLPLAETALPPETAATTRDLVLPLDYKGRQLVAVDLLPGTASVVRSARLSMGSRLANPGDDRVLALWVPGDAPVRLPGGSGWTIPSDAELRVRISYRKRWDRERELVADRSQVGLYFAATPGGQEADTVRLRASGPIEGAATASDRREAGQFIPATAVRAVAIWPEPALAGAVVRVDTVAPDGTRALVATFNARASWERRYWFSAPLDLPPGIRLELTARWPGGAAPVIQGTPLLGVDLLPR